MQTIYYGETEDGLWRRFRRHKLPILPIWLGPDIKDGKIVWGGRTYGVPAGAIRHSPDGKTRYVLLYRPDSMAVPLFVRRAGVPDTGIIKIYADSQRLSRVLTPKNQNEKVVLYLVVALIAAMCVIGFLSTRVH